MSEGKISKENLVRKAILSINPLGRSLESVEKSLQLENYGDAFISARTLIYLSEKRKGYKKGKGTYTKRAYELMGKVIGKAIERYKFNLSGKIEALLDYDRRNALRRGKYHLKRGNYQDAIQNFSTILIIENNETALNNLLLAILAYSELQEEKLKK